MKKFLKFILANCLLFIAFSSSRLYGFTQLPQHGVFVNVKEVLDSLVVEEDSDGDKKITVDDFHVLGTEKGDKRYWIRTIDDRRYEVPGTYYLSNLLQELKLAEQAGYETIQLKLERIFEEPVDRISNSIRNLYWEGLTRRVDEQGLIGILSDEKTATVDGFYYVYVPRSDKLASEYFSKIAERRADFNIKVVRLPEKITPEYVRGLDGFHGILSLGIVSDQQRGYIGVPFVVPGGRFNELYGWDSYFIVLGLLEDDRVELAKSIVDNFVYEITHYGKILNANRTYYLTRSQPPFLTSMALAVYRKLPNDPSSKDWLKNVFEAAIKEYYGVWMSGTRLTKTGLSRYYDSGVGPPPEVEAGHFELIYSVYAKKFGTDVATFDSLYRSGKIKVPELDAYFVHDRCMRESGHDTSYRLENRCADLVTVDLNSLLFKIEKDIAETIDQEFAGTLTLADGKVEKSSEWYSRAENRKHLMNRYLWNPIYGMFFDYDFVHEQLSDYVSAATFYPLWAGLASEQQANLLVKNALPLLEMPGGIASSTEESRGPISAERPLRQWDYPHGWPPHQMLVWLGLLKYNYQSTTHRLIYRWLYTITVNAVHYNGTVPEKFDVVNRSHQVFAEYGNVGTKFAYITREGFGWTNASYQVGLSMLPPEFHSKLKRLIPPEWIFER